MWEGNKYGKWQYLETTSNYLGREKRRAKNGASYDAEKRFALLTVRTRLKEGKGIMTCGTILKTYAGLVT